MENPVVTSEQCMTSGASISHPASLIANTADVCTDIDKLVCDETVFRTEGRADEIAASKDIVIRGETFSIEYVRRTFRIPAGSGATEEDGGFQCNFIGTRSGAFADSLHEAIRDAQFNCASNS
jgi:hypothetical protein